MFSLLYIIIIDCWLTLIFFTFQPMVALINHLPVLTYLLTYLLISSCKSALGTRNVGYS